MHKCRRKISTTLYCFLEIAREQNFTRAAARLGVSHSALNQAICDFEKRIGVRLLARTTRRVFTTEAGKRLIPTVAPLVAAIRQEFSEIRQMENKVSGASVLRLQNMLPVQSYGQEYSHCLPGIPKIKVNIDYGLTDIVYERFDAGIRIGEQVAKDMQFASGLISVWRLLQGRLILKNMAGRRSLSSIRQHPCCLQGVCWRVLKLKSRFVMSLFRISIGFDDKVSVVTILSQA